MRPRSHSVCLDAAQQAGTPRTADRFGVRGCTGRRCGIRPVREAHLDGALAPYGHSSGMSARDPHRVTGGDLGMAPTMVFQEDCARVTWVVPDRVEWVTGR
jgi:hypothetical protein